MRFEFHKWATALSSISRALRQKAPFITASMIGVLITWQIAVELRATQSRNASHSDAGTNISPPAQTRAHRIDVEAIANAHLFGVLIANPPSEELPSAPVAFMLSGTVATQDPKHGFAILASAGNASGLFEAGKSIAAGVTLSEVYSDHIVLVRGNGPEILKLPRLKTASEIQSVTAASAALRAPEAPAASSEEPTQILDVFQPMPSFKNGHYHGVRIAAVRDAQELKNRGLQVGDVVTEIAGVTVTNAEAAKKMLRLLAGRAPVHISVERGGKIEQLEVGGE